MANDKNKDLKKQAEADELEELLRQLGSIEGSDLDLADFTKAALEGVGNDLTDDELDGLLNDSANEDAELKSLASSFAEKDIAAADPQEDGEDSQKAGEDFGAPELELPEELFGEAPELAESLSGELFEEPEDFSGEPLGDAAELAEESLYEPPLPELAEESLYEPPLPELAEEPLYEPPLPELSEPPLPQPVKPLTDEDQLADLLAEVTEELKEADKAAERIPEPTAPAIDDSDSFEYLKELGGPGGALDGFEEEKAESLEEMFDLPDFSFNESFTTGEDDRAGGAQIVTIESAQQVEKRRLRGEKQAEETKRPLLNPDGLLYKLLSPVFGITGGIKGKLGKTGKKLKKNKRAQMLLTIAVMLAALGVSGFFLYRQYRTMKRIIEENKVIVEKPPSQRLNYANYIYAGNSKTLGGKTLPLSKLIIDGYMNAFYFDTYLNGERYFPELRDDQGNYYCMYPALSGTDGETTVYWFGGVKDGAKELHLTIYDSTSQESVVFDVEMGDYEILPSKYIEEPKEARTQEYDFEASVEGGAFSSSMSTVVYRFEGKEGVKIGYGGEGGASSRVSLENTDRATLPLMSTPAEYSANGVTIGRMDFGPVRSLENKGRLTFGSLYKCYELDRFFSASRLFGSTSDNEMTIEFDAYRLVLEGMKKYDRSYVLVYHFEDMAGERIYGEFDATLRIRTYSGLDMRLNPYTYYRLDGGDMIFEFTAPNSVIDNAGPENVYLDIAVVRVKIPDVVTDIQIPSLAESAEDENYAAVKAFAETAYTNRLAVKSGAEGIDLSEWFAEGVLSDASLSGLYTKKSVTEPCEYAVMAHTLARLSENEYFAVVEESWLGIDGADKEHHNKTHKIIVKQNGDNFVIIDDTVE